jgi:hypothetical protein
VNGSRSVFLVLLFPLPPPFGSTCIGESTRIGNIYTGEESADSLVTKRLYDA